MILLTGNNSLDVVQFGGENIGLSLEAGAHISVRGGKRGKRRGKRRGEEKAPDWRRRGEELQFNWPVMT